MDFSKRAAAWVTAQVMSNEFTGKVEGGIDPHTVIFAARVVDVVAPHVLEGYMPQAHDLMLIVDGTGIADMTFDHFREMLGKGPEETQAKIEADLEVQVIADAELAAAVIEEQAGNIEQMISADSEKSKQEIDTLKKEFEGERQELAGKLDGLADKYFEKYPDLSEGQRSEAAETFRGIKEEAMGGLQAQQDTRMADLMIGQQEQRENLQERRKELEETRDERS